MPFLGDLGNTVADGIGPAVLYSATDPGAVGAGKLWSDGSVVKVRNQANAAWISVSSGGTVPAGSVVQMVNTQTGAVATGSTVIPLDDTVPQITEGNEYMTLAVTPTSATNKLRIDVIVQCTSNGANWITAALFQDATAGALRASSAYQNIGGGGVVLTLTHYMTSGTTSATTFRVRLGPNSAATVTLNGTSGGRLFGGVFASSITITEIAV